MRFLINNIEPEKRSHTSISDYGIRGQVTARETQNFELSLSPVRVTTGVAFARARAECPGSVFCIHRCCCFQGMILSAESISAIWPTMGFIASTGMSHIYVLDSADQMRLPDLTS